MHKRPCSGELGQTRLGMHKRPCSGELGQTRLGVRKRLCSGELGQTRLGARKRLCSGELGQKHFPKMPKSNLRLRNPKSQHQFQVVNVSENGWRLNSVPLFLCIFHAPRPSRAATVWQNNAHGRQNALSRDAHQKAIVANRTTPREPGTACGSARQARRP
jgi:hypothetical protein